MSEFTAQDALIKQAIDVLLPLGSSTTVQRAIFLLNNARSQATTADLPPFPVPSVHPAPRRYSARLAGLSGGKYGVWDTETKSWVRITGKSPSAAELLADELNAGSIKL